jgi:type VI secretion system secreted protein Hcp
MNKPSMRKLLAAIAVGGLVPTASFAAMTMYLKIDNIPGEVVTKGHEKSIEVYAYSWGMARAGTSANGGVMTRPCTHVTDLELTKPVDKSSPIFMTNAMSGMVIPKAKLSFVKSTGEIPLEFMTLELTNVVISSVQESGSSGEDRPVENIGLKFAGATFSYKSQDDKGGFGAPVTSTFKAGAC